MNFCARRNLKQSLRHFGLDPEEWHLQGAGTNLFLIIFRQDPEFTLVGRTRSGRRKLEWHNIRLLSV